MPEALSRKLLLIYIHGFIGNETSFQYFPTHVHEALVSGLSSTHIVKTIIYPKFKTSKKTDFARDDLIGWLQQYGSIKTDIILIGHSMGGLLAADVALLAAGQVEGNCIALKHGIPGVVGLDTPFLGVHPGIVVSGLNSLFTKDSTEPNHLNESGQREHLESQTDGEPTKIPLDIVVSGATTTDAVDDKPALSSRSEPPTSLPTPPLPASKSKQSPWSRAFYFVNKHSGDLRKATREYLTSHLEFGGCMADYPSLKGRFVNYYTANTGRPRKKKTQSASTEEAKAMNSNDSRESTREDPQEQNISTPDSRSEAQTRIPSIDVNNSTTSTLDSPEQPSFNSKLTNISPSSSTRPSPLQQYPSPAPPQTLLPPIPPRPSPPTPINPSLYPTGESLKLASRTHSAETKTYNLALKARDASILAQRKEAKKLTKNVERERKRKEEVERNHVSSISNEREASASIPASPQPEPEPKPEASSSSPFNPPPLKCRPFCLLPPKSIHGQRDDNWIQVPMHGVDEIGAHCGIFAAGGGHYDDFVRDVVARIERWAR